MTQATPPDSRVVPAAYLDNEGRLVALEGVPSGGFVAKGRAIPDSWTPLIPASALTARDELLLELKGVFAGEAAPHWVNKFDTTCMRGHWLDRIDNLLGAK